MAAATRKQISDAILANIVALGYFVEAGKRNRKPESAPSPSCYLSKMKETFTRQSINLPPKRVFVYEAWIYVDANDSEIAVPLDILDAALDAIEPAFNPDNTATGTCTLGGLVFSAIIKDAQREFPGDVTGAGLAIISIEVIAAS